MRLALAIARSGLCSRRQAETWIRQGRVSYDGQVVHELGWICASVDAIRVDGRRLPAQQKTQLFLYHKPRKVLTTSYDPYGRACVFDNIKDAYQHHGVRRLLSVGRLDYESEGLLLLTTDGALARFLELPSSAFERVYLLRVDQALTPMAVRSLARGVVVDGFRYRSIAVTPPDLAARRFIDSKGVWVRVRLCEGRNRELRRVFAHFGVSVQRLIRLSYAGFHLGHLAVGALRALKPTVLRRKLPAYFACTNVS